MKKAKRKTNVQIVKSIMEYSDYGAIVQVFIMDAIRKQAEQVAALDPATVKKENWYFISFEGWQGVAKEILRKLQENDKD